MKDVSVKSKNKLKCVCGLCSHKYDNKTCLYNKIIDAPNPEQKMFNTIIAIMKEEKKNDIVRLQKQSKRK